MDPANRLVTAELERRWNAALTAQSQLEAEVLTLQQARESPLSESTRRDLLALARGVPGLWEHPQSSPEHKKGILRIALKEIVVTSKGDPVRLVLHWQGGDHTPVELQKIRSGRHRYITDTESVEIVRALARIEPDARIASILNRTGRRTAHEQSWTARRVCSQRNHHAIAVYRGGERQARGDLSVSEVAAILELKTHVRGATIVLRSNIPDLVRQEFYGFLLAHFAGV